MDHKTQDLYNLLRTSPSGLTEREAEQRLKIFGFNEIKKTKKFRLIPLFLSQFANMFLILLLFASVVSWLTGSPSEALVIGSIVFANAVISFIQEFRAEQSLKSLQSMMSPLALVLRDGKLKKILARQVVPGDILRAEAGDRILADGVIIESFNAMVNESPLTGESVPVAKKSISSTDDISNEERVFTGTTISYGRISFIAENTGMSSRIGKIASITTETSTDKSPLQVELDMLGKKIARLAIFICLAVFFFFIFKDELSVSSLRNTFLFAIALAVAIVLEGLPATVTIGLTFGMRKMAKKGAVIRKLSAVETLGSATVICTDKTGTLTKNEMTVREISTPVNAFLITGSGYDASGNYTDNSGNKIDVSGKADLLLLLETGSLCNNAVYDERNAFGDPTELSILVAARKAGVDQKGLQNLFPRIDEIPFDSDRRMMTTVHRTTDDGKFHIAVKGAPDRILDKCAQYFNGQEIAPINSIIRYNINTHISQMTANALRVIAYAYKELDSYEIKDRHNIESDMIFSGFTGMVDPPRNGVEEAVASCRKAGIRIIMTTGDQKDTALAIARETGIIALDDSRALTGKELRDMSDEELDNSLKEVNVFAQISPEEKMKIVQGLKRKNEIVAMTGDGINDAPALKRADIGVAMGRSGTDIAKDASEMIITDDSFPTIVTAVMEGRAIYDNIRKFILYAFSGIAAEFIVVIFSLLPGIEQLLSAVQILWIDLGTEVLPALALSFDPSSPDVMTRKPRKSNEGIIEKSLLIRVVYNSLIISAGAIALYFFFRYYGSLQKALTVPFVSIIFFQMVNIFTCRDLGVKERSPSPGSNIHLLAAVGISILLTVILVSLPFTARLFNIVSLSQVDWLIIICVSMFIIFFNLIRKNIIWLK